MKNATNKNLYEVSLSQNKIPKIIHYVWLGKGEKPKIVKECIESWRKFCPDFEIMEWNEDNFDINSHPFVKEAIDCKKWAFASDYIRLFVLYTYGGVYLDTDMKLFKNLSPLLCDGAFVGIENKWMLGSAILGCEKRHSLIKRFLDYYNNRHFVDERGNLDQEPNTHIMTSILENESKVFLKNKNQVWKDVVFYPSEFFYPLNWVTKQIKITQNTYGMHLYNNSWVDKRKSAKNKNVKYKSRGYAVLYAWLLNFFISIDLKRAKRRVWKRLENEKKEQKEHL